MKKTVGLVLAALALAGCGGDDGSGEASTSLTVYSGREEELVAPLFERFEEETGIDVEVRYADSAELAATIAEEGDNSPADAFFAQDPGSLGSIEDQLAELPEDVLDRVDERFRDSEGRWVGTSGRARVIVYNTDELSEDEVPDSVFELTEPKWKGKVGVPPTNASFQAFVTAMRLDVGEERTRQWLEDLKANDPKFYERNTPVVEATASGEIQLGLVNHYYLYLVKEEQGEDAPIANKFLPRRRPRGARQRRRRGHPRRSGARRRGRAVRRVPARRRAAALLHRGGRGGRNPARRRHPASGGRADAGRAGGLGTRR